MRLRRRASSPAPEKSTMPDAAPDSGPASQSPENGTQVAVMTMTRDEADLLPVWVRHYAGQVGMEHLLVLDDNSTDGSTDDLPCTVHRLPPLPGDSDYEKARMRLVSGIAAGLLAVYDWVVFCDVDEFLIADPDAHADLPSFLATRRDVPALAPTALNLVHHQPTEAPLDLTRPLLDQRSYAVFAPVMCKPSLKREPLEWVQASHAIRTPGPFPIDPELFMIHLKFADRDRLQAISDHRRALVDADGRAGGSSWARSGEQMVAQLDRIARVDTSTVAEFDPYGVDEDSMPRRSPGGAWRSKKQGQIEALRQNPVVRVPARLKGHL